MHKNGQLCIAFARAQTKKSFKTKQRRKRQVPKIILCTPISSLSKSLDIYIYNLIIIYWCILCTPVDWHCVNGHASWEIESDPFASAAVVRLSSDWQTYLKTVVRLLNSVMGTHVQGVSAGASYGLLHFVRNEKLDFAGIELHKMLFYRRV